MILSLLVTHTQPDAVFNSAPSIHLDSAQCRTRYKPANGLNAPRWLFYLKRIRLYSHLPHRTTLSTAAETTHHHHRLLNSSRLPLERRSSQLLLQPQVHLPTAHQRPSHFHLPSFSIYCMPLYPMQLRLGFTHRKNSRDGQHECCIGWQQALGESAERGTLRRCISCGRRICRRIWYM